jgi:hypothetical protein
MDAHVLSLGAWPAQYPHENECLFAPLTGIEVLRTRIDGAVLIIEARLSVNLNALTIEQVRSGVIICKHNTAIT